MFTDMFNFYAPKQQNRCAAKQNRSSQIDGYYYANGKIQCHTKQDRSKTKQYVVQNTLPNVEQNIPDESYLVCIWLNRKVGFTLSSSSPSSSGLKPIASPNS